MGVNVTCVDIDKKKIEILLNGQIPIYEPGLEEMLLRNQKEGRLKFTTDMYDATLEADALCLLMEWKQFRLPSWPVIQRSMNKALVIDGRNIYDGKDLAQQGFEYYCIGK